MSHYYIKSSLTFYIFHNNRKELLYYICLCLLSIAFETGHGLVLVSEGLCAETLGNPINSFIDRCFRGNHFFMDLRNGHLRDLYKVNCCPGYEQINRYRMGGEIMCKPVCKQACIGGSCIKPGTCQCKRGYFQKSQYECLPVCHPTCKNGICVGIDQCKCKSGYRLLKGSKNECEPVCEKCINGICALPGVCQCNKGFIKKKNSNMECEPYCNPPCVNATCTAIGQCQCLLGYERDGNTSCRPVCKKGCGVGVCSAPELCSCPEGYESTHGEPCQPICKGCNIGRCISPDICYCPQGFTLNYETNECDPVCDNCKNGHCVKPNECDCDPGYAKEEGGVHCEPICQTRCVNGFCNRPGICKCYEGFKLKANTINECEAVCSNSCINSTCVAPDTCRCWMGYEQISSYSCSPVCGEGCGPGECIFPDLCHCPNGYYADSGHSCEPTCSTGCKNGHCIAPEICVCSPGHSLVKEGECKPVCDKNCINSYCTSSNKCECLNGFTYASDTECIPQCSSGCMNGQCSSPETCSCNPGFNAHPEDSSICLPELNPFPSREPSPFLNIYNISSILMPSEDNDTFYFYSDLVLAVNTPCEVIFQNRAENSSNIKTDLMWFPCQPTDTSDKPKINLYCQWPSTDEILDNINENYNLNNTNNSLISPEITKEESDLLDLRIFIIFPDEYSSNQSGYCTFSFNPSSPTKCISLSESSYFIVTILNSTYSSDDIHSELEGTSNPWILYIICITIITVITMTALVLRLMVQSTQWSQIQQNIVLDDMPCKSDENGISLTELNEIIDDTGNT